MLINNVLKKQNQSDSLNNYINLLSIFKDTIIGIDGSLTIGFAAEGFDYFLANDEIVNDTAYINDVLLNLLNENISIQWVYKISDSDENFISNYINSSHPSEKYLFIKEKKIKSLRAEKIKKIDIFLFCTISGFKPGIVNNINLFSRLSQFAADIFTIKPKDALNKNSRVRANKEFEYILKKLENIENNLSFFSARLNIKIKRMSNQELVNYFYNELNPERARHINAPFYNNILNEATFRSSLIYSPAEVNKEYFYIDGYYFKFINMHKLPSQTDSFGIAKILNLESNDINKFFPFDIQIAFNIPEQEKIINKIQSERNIKASLTDAVNGGYVDHKGANITSQMDEFLAEISKLQKKAVNMSLCVRIKSKSLQELDYMSLKILQSFKDFNFMEGIIDNMEHHNLFLSFFPGQSFFNRRFKTLLSPAAASFFPLHKGFVGTENCSIPLKNNRSEPVNLDLYNNRLPSKHGVIFGKTRSGKGFMLNGFLSNFFLSGENYHIIGVDIGGTYRKFCRLFDGDYFEIDMDGTYSLNPFPCKKDIIKHIDREEIFNPDIMVFLIGIIGIMAEPDKSLSPNDKTIIARAIQASYDAIKDENDMPLISDINNVLFNYNEARDADDKRRAMEMGKNLFQWTDISSPYSILLNRKGGLNIDNKIVIFDLQKLKGHEDLQKIIFAVIKNLSFKKMYDKNAKVFFFYDECWEFMNDPKIAELIMHLYKTSAKWGSLVWSITQEPSDLLKTGNIGKSIIENSNVKIFCQLDANVSPDDLSICGLSKKEIEIVKNLKVIKGHYAEYFLKFGKDAAIIMNKPDPFEYWLYCKSSEDEELENKIADKYPNKTLKERLEILAFEYPNGPYGLK
jgi:type IV secretory pathway VirB4 component